jgi:RNA polymerase sigma factor (sigma-70 family)
MTETAFAALVEPHRRELHVHCYRMLGSFEEAEDQVQETLLRAWRSRDSFAGGPGLRAWLYKIATNACLDALRSRARKPVQSFEAAVALMREDIRITMPPHPFLYDGIEAIRPLLGAGLHEHGEWRLIQTAANRMPAAASYLRAPGDTEFRAFKVDVLRVAGGKIAEVTTFDATLFEAFGLPRVAPG